MTGLARTDPPLAVPAGLVLAGGLGSLAAFAPSVALVAAACVIAALSLDLHPSWWVLAALVAAITARVVVWAGAPEVLAHVHLPIVWTAFVLALVRGRTWSPVARRVVLGLGIMTAVVFISWAFDRSEPLRPIFYLGLIGEFFALVAAILLAPPSPRARRALGVAVVVLLAIQIPVAIYQAVYVGPSHAGVGTPADSVTGTLIGATGGSHVLGALATVAIAWLLIRPPFPGRLALAAALTPLPFLTDTKQAVLLFPLAVLVSIVIGQDAPRRRLVAVGVVGIFGFILLLAIPALNKGYVAPGLERLAAGEGTKVSALSEIGSELRSDPASLLFGIGPAESVSHAAMLTVDALRGFEGRGSVLGLRPAELGQRYIDKQYYGGTFESARSSAIGMAGDVGLVGLATYLGLFAVVLLALRERTSAEAMAASIAVALMLFLGPAGNWWEDGQFVVPIAVLTGVALCGVDLRSKDLPRQPRPVSALSA